MSHHWCVRCMVCGLTIVNFDLHVHVFKFVCIQQNTLKIIIIAINHSGYAECLHYDYTID